MRLRPSVVSWVSHAESLNVLDAEVDRPRSVGKRPALRVLHTSDLHLGEEHALHGTDWHGQDCLCPLERVTSAARHSNAGALLVAGDLFDNTRVPDRLVGAAFDMLAGQPFDTVILPGNHDPYDHESVYRRQRLRPLPRSVRVLCHPDGELIRVADGALAIWGRPTVVHEPSHRPLAGAPPRPTGGWYVVIAHGDVDDGPGRAGASSPISLSELSALDVDYVALGHWHERTSVGLLRPVGWYSGPPTVAGIAATANLVSFDTGTTTHVQPLSLLSTVHAPCEHARDV